MKKLRFLALFLIISILIPNFVLALDFNPNYIISDEQLFDYQSMTVKEIQAFLEKHHSYLAKYKTKNDKNKLKTAAQIIYQAAQENKINPQYILVKLQKEQSLITDQNPDQDQLDWATGYGVCDSCSKKDPEIQKYKGFYTQVDRAAGIMRWYYKHRSSEPWLKKPNKTYTIDGQKIKPQNYATAFLYTYTPHIHGNKNFWKLWNLWFKPTYPNGSLVKTANSNDVYLIQDNKKRHIKSYSVLISRFNPDLILIINQTELDKYKDGPEINLPNYSILKYGNKYYLVDNDTIRPFENYKTLQKLGYHQDEIIEVKKEDLVNYKIGSIIKENEPPLGELIKITNNNIYYLKDGYYYAIYDPQIIKQRLKFLDIQNKPISYLQKYKRGKKPILFADGSLIKTKNSNNVYVIEDGKKRHINSEKVFNKLGYKWSNIITTNEFVINAYPSGEPIYYQDDNIAEQYSDLNQNTNEIEQNINTNWVDEMQKTPADQTKYIGPNFETNIDAYVVMDYETEKVLAGKNINILRPAASLTKPLTAYTLLYNGLNLNRYITYNPEIHKSSYHYYRLSPGEKVKNKDLLYASLVSSLNTPTKMLVSNLTTNETEFAQKMDKIIKKIHLKKTKFVEPTGIDENNVTTAYEYALLFKYLSRNRDLKKYLSTYRYDYDELKDLDGKKHHFDYNSNELVLEKDLPFKIITSKTGFIYKAGACLAMIIERPSDHKKFIIVTLGNPDYEHRFSEPKKLSLWALKNF